MVSKPGTWVRPWKGGSLHLPILLVFFSLDKFRMVHPQELEGPVVTRPQAFPHHPPDSFRPRSPFRCSKVAAQQEVQLRLCLSRLCEYISFIFL